VQRWRDLREKWNADDADLADLRRLIFEQTPSALIAERSRSIALASASLLILHLGHIKKDKLWQKINLKNH